MFYDCVKLVRFRYSLMSVLYVRMRQNMAKGPENVSVTTFRVTSSLLHSFVPRGMVFMRYQMGSFIRVTFAHVDKVMSVGKPHGLSMMLWECVCALVKLSNTCTWWNTSQRNIRP